MIDFRYRVIAYAQGCRSESSLLDSPEDANAAYMDYLYKGYTNIKIQSYMFFNGRMIPQRSFREPIK